MDSNGHESFGFHRFICRLAWLSPMVKGLEVEKLVAFLHSFVMIRVHSWLNGIVTAMIQVNQMLDAKDAACVTCLHLAP